MLILVVNGSHSELPDNAGDGGRTSRLPQESLRVGKVNGMRQPIVDAAVFGPRHYFINESTFKSRQLATTLSKPLPWNPPDQIIAHLVACLRAAPGTGYDLHILGAFLPLIPRHLSNGHTALSHAVELLLGAWTNSRQGLPSDMWLDLRAYNRALRSLKAALDDAKAELTTTLTTLCVLQKTEVSWTHILVICGEYTPRRMADIPE